MLLVQHAKCAEHGELIHNAEKHANDSASESWSSVRDRSEPEQAAHDHCLLATERPTTVRPVTAATSG